MEKDEEKIKGVPLKLRTTNNKAKNKAKVKKYS